MKITVIDGLLLLGTYIFYVVVCANFDDILRFMKVSRNEDNRDSRYSVDVRDPSNQPTISSKVGLA